MNCRDLERRLEDLIAGTLPDDDGRRAAEHLEGCAACRDLVALARLSESVAAGAAEPSPDLAPAVLARTGASSGACARARELLAAGLGEGEDPLPELDRELLRAHVAACADCRALEPVFAGLAIDLPRLAEVRPDAGFVDDVLRRTLPFEVQIRRWWDALWPQLWHRPRFASEAAYVGLVVLVLAFATPESPLAALSSGALEVAQHPPRPRLELPEVEVAPRLAAVKRALRSSAGAETAARWGDELQAQAGEAKRIVLELRAQMGTFWDDAASLLETRDDAPSATSETVKEK